MTSGLPEGLDHYLALRAQQHEDRFDKQWASLTAREQSLVREAAVMGYVRGSMFGETRKRDEGFPLDKVILRDVLSGCDAHGDIYPAISHLGHDDKDEFEAWLAANGVPDIDAITDDQRHAGYLNFLRRDEEGEEDENG